LHPRFVDRHLGGVLRLAGRTPVGELQYRDRGARVVGGLGALAVRRAERLEDQRRWRRLAVGLGVGASGSGSGWHSDASAG
jgi:hypothetical protein